MENELYKIRYTPLAYEDLDSIDSYISETLCNESAAERLLDKIEKAAGQLKQFPRMGSEVEDPYLSAKGYRKLVVDNYLLFHRVIYGAREYHDLL